MPEEQKPQVIRRGDAITWVKTAHVKPLNTEKEQWLREYQSLRVQAILEERKELRVMRVRWSNWILSCIVAIVGFDFVVIAFAGFGWIHFSNEYILPAFLLESIVNIIGLAVIIVKYLFSNWGELPKE